MQLKEQTMPVICRNAGNIFIFQQNSAAASANIAVHITTVVAANQSRCKSA